jgi:DNA polymerase III delta prime subunit
MIPWIYVIVLALGYPLVWWLHRRSLGAEQASVSRRLERIREQAQSEAREQVDQARAETQTATMRARIAVSAELAEAKAFAESERDKASRYFLKITDFENERTQWQRLYNQQSIGHGNAQNLMMRTIEDLTRQLQAKGVRAQVPKVLHALREEFLEAHEMPSRALAEAVNRAQTQPPTTEPTA